MRNKTASVVDGAGSGAYRHENQCSDDAEAEFVDVSVRGIPSRLYYSG